MGLCSLGRYGRTQMSDKDEDYPKFVDRFLKI